jgi:hypothetical protein
MKTSPVIFGLLGAFLLPLFATEYQIPKASPLFAITFPEDWTVTHAPESVDGVSEDEGIQLYAQTDDSETIEDSVDETIEYLVTEGVKIKADTEKKNEGEINGMKVSGINWDGTDEDGPCRISLSFIDVGADQVITLLYWGSGAAEKKHAKALESILQSMTAMKATKKGKAKAAKEE